MEMAEEPHEVVAAGDREFRVSRFDGDNAKTGGTAKALGVDGSPGSVG
jgi:hypothetical protein